MVENLNKKQCRDTVGADVPADQSLENMTPPRNHISNSLDADTAPLFCVPGSDEEETGECAQLVGPGRRSTQEPIGESVLLDSFFRPCSLCLCFTSNTNHVVLFGSFTSEAVFTPALAALAASLGVKRP